MSEKKNVNDREKSEQSLSLPPYLRRYIANVNDNISWSSSSDSSTSSESSSSTT